MRPAIAKGCTPLIYRDYYGPKLPAVAKICEILPKTIVFQKICQVFGNSFMPKICHFLKYRLLVLTKQSILDYLSMEYPKLR